MFFKLISKHSFSKLTVKIVSSLLLLFTLSSPTFATDCFSTLTGDQTMNVGTACVLKTYVDGNNPARLVSGVDSGAGVTNSARLTLSSGSMTVSSNETLVVGELIIAGGSTAIASGGVIEIGKPMWMVDADADGYPTDTKIYVQPSAPTDGLRLNTMTDIATADCSDATYNVANSCQLAIDNMEYSTDGNAQTAYVSTGIGITSATGGTITYIGGYTIHKFTSSGTFTVNSGSDTVEYLIVAGGGGGGGWGGGGGGAGGVLASSTSVSAGSYPVVVGAGGAGSITVGAKGGNSSFNSITATGGGLGGGGHASGTHVGGTGGSGGGGGMDNGSAGAGTGGQGYSGGVAGTAVAGGGGGASAVGVVVGGNGVASSITGSSLYYGGGGGAGRYTPAGGGGQAGGLGGGGTGGPYATAGSAGTANTGGGGGGGGAGSSAGVGAAGGSGIVVIRYKTPPHLIAYTDSAGDPPTGGTITTGGGYSIHKFTSSGTFTVPSGTSGTAQFLIVGGGGGGGGWGGGGGGGGGVISSSSLLSAGPYSVIVGAGGTGTGTTTGTNGGTSSFASNTAIGGGGGGRSAVGSNGGSGGGGGHGVSNYAGGVGTIGQGYNGASGTDPIAGGGGGGGAIGLNDGGGIGFLSSITGVSTYYAGGGGGGKYTPAFVPGGVGGLGGGGNGGAYNTPGTAATVNTGGGGGGGGAGSSAGVGASGGSGVVVIKFLQDGSNHTEGLYSLKAYASTNASGKTLTRTLSPTVNLSGYSSIKFDLRSSRTGSNIKVGLHDSGGTTTEITPNVTVADTFQTVTMDISGVANANKDVIDQVIITIVNASAANTFYIDNLYAE